MMEGRATVLLNGRPLDLGACSIEVGPRPVPTPTPGLGTYRASGTFTFKADAWPALLRALERVTRRWSSGNAHQRRTARRRGERADMGQWALIVGVDPSGTMGAVRRRIQDKLTHPPRSTP
jgi:hypothetical protein